MIVLLCVDENCEGFLVGGGVYVYEVSVGLFDCCSVGWNVDGDGWFNIEVFSSGL